MYQRRSFLKASLASMVSFMIPVSWAKKEKSIMTVNSIGTRMWKNKKGELHREDGPAVYTLEGTMCWYRNNKLHREDGPAIMFTNGLYGYYLNGKFVKSV